MANLGGLNLGGADKNPATPPSGPATPPEELQTENAEARSDEPAARWSSHPIVRFTVGGYAFADGLLVLQTPEEADAFQKMYDELPVYEQTRIKKIDISAAEALVRQRLAEGGGATKEIDSSVGDRAPNKAVGTGSLLDT